MGAGGLDRIWETGHLVRKIQSKGHDTGCLGLVHWDDPEGWDGEGGGRRVQDGLLVSSVCMPSRGIAGS